MDEKPIIADTKPIGVELTEGEQKYFCACGRSESQPFCDGKHAGSSFTPLAFSAAKTGTAYLCQCKHTKTPPYCDGSHATLETLEDSQ